MYQPQNGIQHRSTHHNDQVVFMDIDLPDFTQLRHTNTKAEKQDHKARGTCFRCGRQGHMACECLECKEQPFKPSFQLGHFTSQQQSFLLKPQFKQTFQKKPFRKSAPAKCSQGFRKYNKPTAYQYVQQACATTIEEMEEEDENKYLEYE